MSQDTVASYTSIEWVILTVLAIIVIIIFAWAIYSFFHSIFLFIFSKGEEDNKKKARDGIRFMIWGVILTVILLLFFPVALKYIGVQWYEVYEAKNIFARVGQIFDSATDFGKDVTGSQKWVENWWFKTDPWTVTDYSL